jgi:hypothetical protein
MSQSKALGLLELSAGDIAKNGNRHWDHEENHLGEPNLLSFAREAHRKYPSGIVVYTY